MALSRSPQKYKPITESIIAVVKGIPRGYVASYREIAERAGYPGAARQVARTLSSLSDKEHLPWHRVVNSQWKISLKGEGESIQRLMLEEEGIIFCTDLIPLEYRWHTMT